MKKLSIAVLAVALSSSTAMAGGYTEPVAEVVIAAPYNWSGFYAGLSLAPVMGDIVWETSAGGTSLPGDYSGQLLGASLGYNRQSGRMVYGIVGDVTAGEVNAVSATGPGFNCTLTGCETAISEYMSLRAKLGLARDRTLFFATAGFASAHLLATSAGGTTVHGDDTLQGWVASIGIEQAISDRLSLSAEYMHTDLGQLDIPTLCSPDCSADVAFGGLRVGINLRW